MSMPPLKMRTGDILVETKLNESQNFESSEMIPGKPMSFFMKKCLIVFFSFTVGMMIEKNYRIIYSFSQYFEKKQDSSKMKETIIKEDSNSIIESGKKLGLPQQEKILPREDYIISYNYHLKQPIWVFEKLTKDDVTPQKTVERDKCFFGQDPMIPRKFSATNSDFQSSGYDRGHMAASANHYRSQDAMCSTFFLSNISPQVGKGFNQNAWSYLERYCRGQVKNYKESFMITGPLFVPRLSPVPNQNISNGSLPEGTSSPVKYNVTYQVIGKSQISVPTHFFKVFLGITQDGIYEVQCFIMPNEVLPDEIDVKSYYASMETIENYAGISLFENIARNKIIPVRPKVDTFVKSKKVFHN